METLKIQVEDGEYIHYRIFTCEPNSCEADAITEINVNQVLDATIYLLTLRFGESRVYRAVKSYARELIENEDEDREDGE